jgi:hypothetical protein
MTHQFLGSSAATLAKRHTHLAAAATSLVVGISTWYSSGPAHQPTLNEEAHNNNTAQRSNDSFRMDVHLMDKIQQKEYLATNHQDAIPSTLRVLAIDLPDMRTEAFSGDCRLAHDKIFVEDVAAPKVVSVGSSSGSGKPEAATTSQNTKATKLKVAQKALAKVRRRLLGWQKVTTVCFK